MKILRLVLSRLLVLAIFLFALISTIFFQSHALAEPSSGWLGMRIEPLAQRSLLASHLNLDQRGSLVVLDVFNDSSAGKSGLKRGDVILSVDGHDAGNLQQVRKIFQQLKPGQNVSLKLISAGQTRDVVLTATVRPKQQNWPRMPEAHPFAFPPHFPSEARRHLFNHDQGQNGDDNHSAKKQQIFYRTMIQTPNGLEITNVVIHGDPRLPETKVDVDLGNKHHQTTIGELNKLPPEAKQAVKLAMKNTSSEMKIQIKPSDEGKDKTPTQDGGQDAIKTRQRKTQGDDAIPLPSNPLLRPTKQI